MITSRPTKPVHIKVCVPPIRVPKIPAKKANIIDDSENVIHLPLLFIIQNTLTSKYNTYSCEPLCSYHTSESQLFFSHDIECSITYTFNTYPSAV